MNDFLFLVFGNPLYVSDLWVPNPWALWLQEVAVLLPGMEAASMVALSQDTFPFRPSSKLQCGVSGAGVLEMNHRVLLLKACPETQHSAVVRFCGHANNVHRSQLSCKC